MADNSLALKKKENETYLVNKYDKDTSMSSRTPKYNSAYYVNGKKGNSSKYDRLRAQNANYKSTQLDSLNRRLESMNRNSKMSDSAGNIKLSSRARKVASSHNIRSEVFNNSQIRPPWWG